MRDAKGDRQKCAFGVKRKKCIFVCRMSMTHPCVADLESVKEAIASGVKVLLTIHGSDLSDVSEDFINNQMFKNIVVLTKKERPRRS